MTSLYDQGSCMVCGDPTKSAKGVVCSRDCSWVWNGWRKRRDSLPGRLRKCAWCLMTFEFNQCGKPNEGRYCSRTCAARGHHWGSKIRKLVVEAVQHSIEVRKARQANRACFVCGRVTMRSVCSKGCHNQRERNRHRARYDSKSFNCRECGVCVVPQYGLKLRVFCGDDCRKKANRRVSKPDYGKNHRKRARHYGAEYEPVNRTRVLERDGWVCGICGGKISRLASFPHPKSASLDHIVPLSRGGDHTYRNVQAAHFMCNSVKSDSAAGSQLRLFG